MTDKLTPVPCGCGGEAEVRKHTFYRALPLYRVCCRNCGVSTPPMSIVDNAIDAWNKAMGAENICENCKEYIFDETCEGWCRCDDEYPTPRKYGCNCFERKGES